MKAIDPATVNDVIERLEARREQISAAMLERIFGAIADYGAHPRPDDLRASVQAHCDHHFAAFLASARAGKPPSTSDVAFLVDPVLARVREGISLDGLLHAFRIGHTAAWEAVLEEAGDASDAALALAQPSMIYIDVVCTRVAEVYLAETQRQRADAERAQRDLLEQLLDGAPLEGGDLDRTRSFNLELRSVVVVAKSSDPTLDPGEFRTPLDEAISRFGLSALAVVRRGVWVAIVGLGARQLETLVSALREVAPAYARVGVGTVAADPSEIPRSHADSRSALAATSVDEPLVALGEHGVYAHLIANSDSAATRLVGKPLRELMDGSGSSDLVATASAYLDSDLSVTAAAVQLFVHENTVRYRLRQIEARTGLDLRRFADLLELRVALDLAERQAQQQ